MRIKDCFVIMPFSDSHSHSEAQWTEIFEKFFKPIWIAFHIDCYRTKVPRGSITKDIIEKLYSASVVFADLTDSNPNVMYELGVRHTFKKPSVMVKAKGSEIPFDVNDYKVFEYEYSLEGLEGLKNHIAAVIQDIRKYPNKSDNPVWDFGYTTDFLVDYYRNVETIPKLTGLNEELTGNLEKCNEFLEAIKDIELPAGRDREEEVDGAVHEFLPNIRNEAMTHLRITRYIDFPDEDWGTLNEIASFYAWCYFWAPIFALYNFPCPDDKQRIDEAREILRKGIDVVNRRISELKLA